MLNKYDHYILRHCTERLHSLYGYFFKQIITMRNNDFFVGQQSFTAILQQILGWPYKTD